jgi:hypothetical protein
MDNKFKFDVVLSNFKREEVVLAKKIANANKNYFLQAFQKQGWGGRKWDEVQRRVPGTFEYKYPKKKGLTRRTKPILIGKGILRRAVADCVKSVTPRSIRFRVDLPYAEVHNEGLGHMAKRKFMGWNKDIDIINRDLIKQSMRKVFNKK